ncbi:MAG: hypothetical protein QM831_36900 [Kofleriaceae bacterium]
MRWSLVLIAACHGSQSAVPAPEPVHFDVAYERVLPARSRDQVPFWAPGDKTLVIGETRWSREGQRQARNPFVTDGQLAMVGIASDGRMIGSAWENFVEDHDLRSGESWLTLDGKAVAPLRTSWQGLPDELLPEIQVSPSGAFLFAIERDGLVLREVATGQVLERFAAKTARGCWVDDSHIAVLGHELSTFDLTTHRTTAGGRAGREDAEHVPEGALIACDSAGGAAILATDTDLAIVNLESGSVMGRIAQPDAAVVAIGDHGEMVAVATESTLTIYHHELGWYATAYTHAMHDIKHAAFSRDGKNLAITGQTLVMFGRDAVKSQPLALSTQIELPAGFALDRDHIPTDYAQLPRISQLSATPLELVRAAKRDDYAYVTTLVIAPATISAPPPTTDAELPAYASIAMHDLFDNWSATELDPDSFTIKPGHRDGKLTFEAFEVWRDGCEPYDGYTQVVIDHDLLFVTRALVPPHASTKPWLQVFFDQPFHARTELAHHRRRGPDSGPC